VIKKSLGLAAVFLIVGSLIFLSCKKVNEATDLGSDLIPAVDNVNTFELFLETETDNFSLLDDTTRILVNDDFAVGTLNDPEFGKTEASLYFPISSAKYGTYPFVNKDFLEIDSVILSLAYAGAYGDTSGASQTVKVFEVAQSVNLTDSIFKYTDNEPANKGVELGSKTFAFNTLKDTFTITEKKVAQKVANVVRVPLTNSLGTRLAAFDTINHANGGFLNDSIFQSLFKGLVVKTNGAGNALSYFDVFDNTKTKLTVYFRTTVNGVKDTSAADFIHLSYSDFGISDAGGAGNTIKKTPGGNWATYLANANLKDDKLFIQSSPGSYAGIKVPGLSTLDNRLIHLAELVAYRIPSAQDNILSVPPLIYLDKINSAKDTAYLFEKDQSINSTSGEVSYLGGNLKENKYRFNITRHVQDILTNKEPNMELRLYAPYRTTLKVKNNASVSRIVVPASNRIANGRVVVAGGNHSDPNLRLRLRLVYSKL
jgi:hypothetical protein